MWVEGIRWMNCILKSDFVCWWEAMCASEIRRDPDSPKNQVKLNFFRSLVTTILKYFYSTSERLSPGTSNTLYSLILVPYSMLFTSLICTAFYYSSLLGTETDDVHSPS